MERLQTHVCFLESVRCSFSKVLSDGLLHMNAVLLDRRCLDGPVQFFFIVTCTSITVKRSLTVKFSCHLAAPVGEH